MRKDNFDDVSDSQIAGIFGETPATQPRPKREYADAPAPSSKMEEGTFSLFSPLKIVKEAARTIDVQKIELVAQKLSSRLNVSRQDMFDQLHSRYSAARSEMYQAAIMLEKEKDDYEPLKQRVHESIETISAILSALNKSSVPYETFMNMDAYNTTSGYPLAVVALACINKIKLVCPECNSMDDVIIIDLSTGLAKHSPYFVVDLHGRLLHNCTKCAYHHVYPLDGFSMDDGIFIYIPSRIQEVVDDSAGQKALMEGVIDPRAQHTFFLGLSAGDTRDKLFERWKQLVGKAVIPVPPVDDSFESKSFTLKKTGDNAVKGLLVGTEVAGYVQITLSLTR